MTAIKSEGSFKLSPASVEEQGKVQQIIEIMGDGCDSGRALTFLRRNGGNVEKTLSALLDSAADSAPTTSTLNDYSELRAAAAGVVAPHNTSPSQMDQAPVIDLTAADEDENLSRALKASLEDQAPTFGPSERAPDPNWAVVPSNVEMNNTTKGFVSQDDQDLNQAIEESLYFDMDADPLDDRPLDERIRQGDSPVTLCPTRASYNYASNIIYALYFVPQVRDYIAAWRPNSDPDDIEGASVSSFAVMPPSSGPELIVWTLLETFINMEFSRMNELCPDKALENCGTIPWDNPNRPPGDLTFEFYSHVSWAVETIANGHLATVSPEPLGWSRLFHFRHGKRDALPYKGPFNKEFDVAVVRVSVPNNSEANDLMSCLATEFVDEANDFKQDISIVDASAVLAFEISRYPSASGDRTKFSYPPTVYLDQFMRENAPLSTEKRRARKAASEEITRLQSTKTSLLTHKGRDVIADLRSAIFYFQQIAEHNDDELRRATMEDTVAKLGKIVVRIEEKIKSIDVAIEACKARAATALVSPELQRHRYDLRAVLMHDGLYGRNHLYTYTKYKGAWWKAMEYDIHEVSEDVVLNDNAGLHLGAGAYFLIYSRFVTEEEENARRPWPTYLKDTVKQNNKTFFEQLPDDITADLVDPNSPPTMYTTPLGDVSPVNSHVDGEPMEIDHPEDPV
ncbi:hypothetical protein BDW22DRAFT_1360280 [Trametopsis cervina]|nr:hypothetical protein BDW22DRAFT_1360280 [Trametopsis cervina]